MSRCFPFPPPGYEKEGQLIGKKAPVDVDLSSKKKRKHKHNEEEKKDKRDKKNRRQQIKCNGDIQELGAWIHLPVLTDNEKHGEAELGDGKHALPKSPNSAQTIMNHHGPSPSNYPEHLKNGRLRKPESINRVCDNAGRAEQSSTYKGTTSVTPNHNDGQSADQINNHLVLTQGEEPNCGIMLPSDGEKSHVLKPMHNEWNAVNGELDHPKTIASSVSLSRHTTEGISQTKLVNDNRKSGSGKRRHSKFKGFLEFAAPPQQDFWPADSEGWLFPRNHLDDTSKLKVEMEGHKFRVSENGPVHSDCIITSEEKESELKDGVSQVWAEARFLPSVGIHALPYVVPY